MENLDIVNFMEKTDHERIIDIENFLDSEFPDWRVIEPPPSDLPIPIYEGIVTNALSVDNFIFNPAYFVNNKWVVFAVNNGRVFRGTSNNGLTDFTWYVTNCGYGSVIPFQGWRCSYHLWNIRRQGYCTSLWQGSESGTFWEDMARDDSQTCGEDRNLLLDGNIIRNYIRPNPSPQLRTIGYCESSNNGYNWTGIIEVLRPDSTDGANIQFYEMSVIKTVRGYFGLLNVFNTNGFTIDLQLVHSANGIGSWRRLNERRNFINRRPGIKQMFGNWSVIGDTAYIYTIENEQDHESGGVHFSSRYKIALTDLYRYL